ncbi:hypothetical protein BDN67DRAFT_970456 [Paxillus ammoniavirescens]|nr:hypothetical protein BDN67DRAFT_970456 [Paxillus ammoniavirescens]
MLWLLAVRLEAWIRALKREVTDATAHRWWGDNEPQELCETKLCAEHLRGQNSREWNQRMSVLRIQLMFVHPPALLQASLCHRGPSSTARFCASFLNYIS